MNLCLSARLQKRFGGFDLDVAFEAGPGITVLFGPSGAGKSLTLKILAGLETPDAGRIALGERVFFDSDDGRRRVSPRDRRLGCVFQNAALFPHLTVQQNIAFGGRTMENGERTARVAELVKLFRLEGLEARAPSQISGGQQQRVALARAIVGRPLALLLDEPFSALDHPTRVAMRECLRSVMHELGLPVLLVTHDLYEACSMADRMIVLEAGRVAQEGTPQQIVQAPANEAVAALMRRDRVPFGDCAGARVPDDAGRDLP